MIQVNHSDSMIHANDSDLFGFLMDNLSWFCFAEK